MNTRCDPKQLVVRLLQRSSCNVSVACVIADNYGIHSWGFNNPGQGFGEHAEAMAIRRANRKRLKRSTLFTAAVRRKNNRTVTAQPCEKCARIVKVQKVVYRDKHGVWNTYSPKA